MPYELISEGGIVMWPIFFCSFVALAIVACTLVGLFTYLVVAALAE